MMIDRQMKIGEGVLWFTACLFVLGAHAGAAAWMMAEKPPEIVINEAVQSAIMIEIAPEPEAVKTEEQEIAVDDEVSKEALDTPDPVKQEIVEEVVPKEPVKEPEELKPVEPEVVEVPDPVPVQEPVIEKAEIITGSVPAKQVKPEKPKKKKPKRQLRRKKPRKQPSAQAKAKRKAKARARRAKRTAARQSSTGLFSSRVTPARWQSRLMAHLERRKRYPSGANNRGGETVYVRFRIDAQGNVSSIRLTRSSGYARLDKAALNTVRKASPVPAPPPGVKRTITVPIRFD